MSFTIISLLALLSVVGGISLARHKGYTLLGLLLTVLLPVLSLPIIALLPNRKEARKETQRSQSQQRVQSLQPAEKKTEAKSEVKTETKKNLKTAGPVMKEGEVASYAKERFQKAKRLRELSPRQQLKEYLDSCRDKKDIFSGKEHLLPKELYDLYGKYESLVEEYYIVKHGSYHPDEKKQMLELISTKMTAAFNDYYDAMKAAVADLQAEAQQKEASPKEVSAKEESVTEETEAETAVLEPVPDGLEDYAFVIDTELQTDFSENSLDIDVVEDAEGKQMNITYGRENGILLARCTCDRDGNVISSEVYEGPKADKVTQAGADLHPLREAATDKEWERTALAAQDKYHTSIYNSLVEKRNSLLQQEIDKRGSQESIVQTSKTRSQEAARTASLKR